MQKAVVAAGYADVDIIKTLETFPARHGLVNVQKITRALGGAACNCALDLARLSPETRVRPLAALGRDEYGAYMEDCFRQQPNIDLSLLIYGGETAFTDVLDEADTRVRTFLAYRGANKTFDVDSVQVENLDCDLFHVGYICLMDALDSFDETYGTRMARLLHKVRRAGILTSVDAVTDSTGRHKKLMPPAMKYADIFCVNEHEAGAAFDTPLRREDGRLDMDAMEKTLRQFRECGVAKWAVIHAPECVLGMDENDQIQYRQGAALPEGFVQGTVGAGDAFVSGLLLGARGGSNLADAMEDGIAAAVSSLSRPGASEGVLPLPQARTLLQKIRRGEYEK